MFPKFGEYVTEFEDSEFKYLVIYITVAVIAFVLVIFLILLSIVKKMRDLIKVKVQASIDAFFWNGFANSVLYTYAKNCLGIGVII